MIFHLTKSWVQFLSKDLGCVDLEIFLQLAAQMSYPPLPPFLEITKQEAVTDYALSHFSYLRHIEIWTKLSSTNCGQQLAQINNYTVLPTTKRRRSNQRRSDCRSTYCWSQQELQCSLVSKAITRQSKRLFQAIPGQFVFLLFTKEVSTVNNAMGQDVCHKLSWIHFILQLYMIGVSIYGNVHVGN